MGWRAEDREVQQLVDVGHRAHDARKIRGVRHRAGGDDQRDDGEQDQETEAFGHPATVPAKWGVGEAAPCRS